MIDERLEEQAALYSLGNLPAAETPAFEAALLRDAELRALVVELRAVGAVFGGNTPRVEPPAGLKQNILNEIDRREKMVSLPSMESQTRRPSAWLPWAIAACFAILCTAFIVHQYDLIAIRLQHYSLNARIQELNRLADTLQAATNSLQQTVASLQAANRVDNFKIALMGSLLENSPKTVAVSVWDAEHQNGILEISNLSLPPEGKDYQLWVIDPDYPMPVDAGVFHVDAQGRVRFQFKPGKSIKKADKFAVTVEIKGGSPIPTVKDMVLIGG